jgi:hypothetical protein
MPFAIFWGAVGVWVFLMGVELVGLVQGWRGRRDGERPRA